MKKLLALVIFITLFSSGCNSDINKENGNELSNKNNSNAAKY